MPLRPRVRARAPSSLGALDESLRSQPPREGEPGGVAAVRPSGDVGDRGEAAHKCLEAVVGRGCSRGHSIDQWINHSISWVPLSGLPRVGSGRVGSGLQIFGVFFLDFHFFRGREISDLEVLGWEWDIGTWTSGFSIKNYPRFNPQIPDWAD